MHNYCGRAVALSGTTKLSRSRLYAVLAMTVKWSEHKLRRNAQAYTLIVHRSSHSLNQQIRSVMGTLFPTIHTPYKEPQKLLYINYQLLVQGAVHK